MAASVASSLSSTFSSLSLRRFSPLHQHKNPNILSLPPRKPLNFKPIKAQSSSDFDAILSDDILSDDTDPEESYTFDPPEIPEDFVQPPSFDENKETEEEIAAAYEELYGPAFSGISVLGNDVHVMDKVKESTAPKGKIKDGLEETVVQVRRVTKVVKGGKQMNFRAVVVVGDKKGRVGVGCAKATEVITAVQKSALDARRNIITVPLTKYLTFPHRSDGKFGAAKVMLRPACPGTGVLAGGSVRAVLEMAGVENALGKQLGSDNALNNARATIVAVQKMRTFREVAEQRGIPMEELWKR